MSRSLIKPIRDWSIFSKILVASGISVFLMALTIDLVLIPVFKQRLVNAKRSAVHEAVTIVYATLSDYAAREARGELTREGAQFAASETIRKIRYKDNDYFWISDVGGRIVMHPERPDLDGKAQVQDSTGRKIFAEFAAVASTNKDGGFVEYHWPKQGQNTPIEKLSYVRRFEPWGWVIGTGIYAGDIRNELEAMVSKIHLVGGLFILVATILSVLLASRISAPLRAGVGAVRKIAKGDLDIKFGPQGKDEPGLLISAIEEMAFHLKESERQKEEIRDRLFQASRLACLGTLASGLAHEVNNPLAILQGNLERIRNDLKQTGIANPAIEISLDRQEKAIERIIGVVKALQKYAYTDSKLLEKVAAHETIAKVLQISEPMLNQAGVVIEQELAAEQDFVHVVPVKFEHVLAQFFVNSKEAFEGFQGAKKIRISTFNEPGRLLIKISDTGPGINPAHLEHVFDPFFTTKPPGQGMGMGLAVAQSITSGMGGLIQVESDGAHGTSFTVMLPLFV